MSKFYSRTTNGFYDSAVNSTMPPDAVAVTDDAYAALFAAQSSGQVIQADANGNPESVTFTPSSAQVHAALQASAQAALVQSDAVSVRCSKAGVAYPSAWLSRDEALRAIVNGADTTSTTLPSAPAYPVGT